MAWLSAFPKAITKKPLIPLLAVVFGVAAYFGTKAGIAVIFSAILWGVFFFFLVAFFMEWAKTAGATAFIDSYTTRDVVVMAALIAIGGVAKAYWGQLRMVLEAAFGPYAEFVIGPGFYIWGILACNLVRKPLSGTISMTIGSAVEILAGNPFGLPVFLFNFWEGFGPDISYNLIFRNKRYDLLVAIIGGILSADLGLVYGWYYFGFSQLPALAFIIYVIEVTLSGVAAGIIGYYLAKALERIGVKPPSEAVIEP
ncbi:MAG: ECF transporter S component [Anaerolineae bacterium]|nr:ECF transporter S component [Anaerolineae bacterium]